MELRCTFPGDDERKLVTVSKCNQEIPMVVTLVNAIKRVHSPLNPLRPTETLGFGIATASCTGRASGPTM